MNAGHPISKVDPIMSETEKRDIASVLGKLYPHVQVNFS